LARAESKFYLAKDYSRGNEKQYEKSMRLFQELQQEFPDNPLWTMLFGSLHYRVGKPQQGEVIYREIYQNTAGKSSEVNAALHRAAGQALERLHPDQKLP
jgi:hypothetical protein